MNKARKIPVALPARPKNAPTGNARTRPANLDWSRAKRVRLPNLQPSTTAISLRLPISLLEEIKLAAHKRDVPYQSLIKIWLSEKVG
jgi:CopG antitoxin of type II toxin-antitoxin system